MQGDGVRGRNGTGASPGLASGGLHPPTTDRQTGSTGGRCAQECGNWHCFPWLGTVTPTVTEPCLLVSCINVLKRLHSFPLTCRRGRAPLTRKRHTMPHPAQPQHAKYWAPRTRKRHQQEHRPQRPTESSDPTRHAKGRTGDCPGPP